MLAVALAWIVGVYVGGMPVNTVMGGFPEPAVPDADRRHAAVRAGADRTGRWSGSTHHAVRICRGNRGLIPVMFFLLGAALASMGPGNIATAALRGAAGDGDGQRASASRCS